MCNISLVVQNLSVRRCLTRSGGRILDLTAKVTFGSCTLVTLTDLHTSVEALEPLMNSPMCEATNINSMNNICPGMKVNPTLDAEKDYPPVLPGQKGTIEKDVIMQSFVAVTPDNPTMPVINSLCQPICCSSSWDVCSGPRPKASSGNYAH